MGRHVCARLLAASPEPSPIIMLLMGVGCLVFLIICFIILKYGMLWLKALTSGSPVSLMEMIFMSLRMVPPRLVVETYVRLRQAGVSVTTVDLQRHVLAEGNIERVADWLVAAQNSGVPVDWGGAARLDLAQELRNLDDVPADDRKRVFARIAKG